MTRTVRITFIVAGVCGLLLAIAAGWHNADLASDAMELASTMAATAVTSDFALQQFEHADSAHARQAAMLQIIILKQLERVPEDSISKYQLGYAYTRLAMIEEAAGAPEAEREALNRAREWFRLANPGHELTDEQLKSAVKRLDQGLDRLETRGAD